MWAPEITLSKSTPAQTNPSSSGWPSGAVHHIKSGLMHCNKSGLMHCNKNSEAIRRQSTVKSVADLPTEACYLATA